MTKPTYRRIERNIYVDRRCGSYRFRVRVYPLPPATRTFDTEADGWLWDLQTRAELVARKHALFHVNYCRPGQAGSRIRPVFLTGKPLR